MGFWREPQKTWIRRAIFQIHLWTGIAIGLYIVLISVTGSAVVFRRDLLNSLNVRGVPADAKKMSEEELRKAIAAVYPGYEIKSVSITRRRTNPAEVKLTQGTETKERRFDPYTGEDMGALIPASVQWMEWTVNLHDYLLLDRTTGMKLNGIGGLVLTLLVLTGVVIWWRGSAAWFKGFYFNPKSRWKRINFDLHSALGFWSFAILAIWGVSGIYFGYPEPFSAVINYFWPPPNDDLSMADKISEQMVRLHFGRYGGMGVRISYVVLGLAPAIMFVTGAIMWWNRVVRRWRAETARGRSAVFARQAPAAVPETLE